MVGLKAQISEAPRDTVQTRAAFDRIKIAFVIDSIDSWQAGGTEQQVAKFISALHRPPFRVELYLLRPPADLKILEFPCPVHVASSKGPVKGARIKTIMELVRLFRQRRPNIVQTFFRDGTYYGVTAAKLARVPTIIVSRRNSGHWKSLADRVAVKVINRMADAWQCNSRTVAESLKDQERVPDGRIDILPNAIDLEKFSPPSAEERALARERLCLAPAAPVFVSVANLTPVKDHMTLVEAAAFVGRPRDEARFILVGEGPLRSRLEERVKRLGLEANVRLAGAQPDVRPFLAAADIGLLTSRSEGSSNALLEYMAMELPVVVSDIPANRELVSGVFFEPGNPVALAEKILDLWGNAALRIRMSQEHLRRCKEFSEENFALRAQAFYARLAAQHLDMNRQY
jgi:L-malate glycosyltransferase